MKFALTFFALLSISSTLFAADANDMYGCDGRCTRYERTILPHVKGYAADPSTAWDQMTAVCQEAITNKTGKTDGIEIMFDYPYRGATASVIGSMGENCFHVRDLPVR